MEICCGHLKYRGQTVSDIFLKSVHLVKSRGNAVFFSYSGFSVALKAHKSLFSTSEYYQHYLVFVHSCYINKS